MILCSNGSVAITDPAPTHVILALTAEEFDLLLIAASQMACRAEDARLAPGWVRKCRALVDKLERLEGGR